MMQRRLRGYPGAAGWLLLALFGLASVPGCGAHGSAMGERIQVPIGRDYFEFPAKYRGRIVRLADLEVARAELSRPLVFRRPSLASDRLVVLDPRGLLHRSGLNSADRVTILFRCTEGRTDRGNLLLAVSRASPPDEPIPSATARPSS